MQDVCDVSGTAAPPVYKLTGLGEERSWAWAWGLLTHDKDIVMSMPCPLEVLVSMIDEACAGARKACDDVCACQTSSSLHDQSHSRLATEPHVKRSSDLPSLHVCADL